MYSQTPVRSCTAKIKEKKVHFRKKAFFSSLNRNDWYILRTILVSLC